MPMDQRYRWLRAAAVTGLLYVLVGVTTAALSRSASSPPIRTGWRLAAWAISAVAFAAHIGSERRRGAPPRRAALHTAAAVAMATLVLAASAVIHQLTTSSPRPAMLAAFVIWPALTGGPAFLVAFGIAALLGRKDQPTEAAS